MAAGDGSMGTCAANKVYFIMQSYEDFKGRAYKVLCKNDVKVQPNHH